MKQKPKMPIEEQIENMKVEYPEIEVIQIAKMKEMGEGAFIWYQNPTIKETVIEHRNRRGWIPAQIFVDGIGHYIMCNEKKLNPETITKKGA